jgi:hypothetical protein
MCLSLIVKFELLIVMEISFIHVTKNERTGNNTKNDKPGHLIYLYNTMVPSIFKIEQCLQTL